MKIKSLKEIKNLKGLRALVRVDYNLSFINGKLDFKDNMRIRASLATIKYLLAHGATVILVAHLGRPEGWDKKLSLAPIAKYLAKLLRKPARPVRDSECVVSNGVNFISDDITKKDIRRKIKKGVNMLENIRFYAQESKNDKIFSKLLSGLADIYINEGFSVSHREDASVSGVQNFLPSYAGLNLEDEIKNLSRLLPKNIKRQNRPYVALMGGAKISTKIGLINKLLKSADNVLLGGALVNDILKSRGYSIGESLSENINSKIIKRILKSKKIVFPKDFVVGGMDGKKNIRIVNVANTKKLCGPKEKIFDIGPETILEFSKYIKKRRQ